MKKMIPVAALAVFALMFTSCKKDYTCTCTFTGTGTGTGTTTQTFSLGKQTKKDAESACNNYVNTVSTGGTTVGWTCHI